MYNRKVYEITGYADTENGVAYCLNCMKDYEPDEEGKVDPAENYTPIFLGDEWDAPGPACNNCHELIEINPIHYKEED